MTDRAQVERHYASDGITGRVLTAVRNVNRPDVEITPDTLAPGLVSVRGKLGELSA